MSTPAASLAPPSPRPVASDPELDRREEEWWAVHSALENDFLWVLSEDLSHRVRRHYVDKIVAASASADEIIELGCGTGWLTRLLARCGARRVRGVDFSSEQIDRARAALPAEMRAIVSFERLKLPGRLSVTGQNSFVLCHAFLHHLTAAEIVGVLRQLREETAVRELCLVEPLTFPAGPEDTRQTLLYREAATLVAAPAVLRRLQGRALSLNELRVRQMIEKRWWGRLPLGPSPKELPFSRAEMDYYLRESGWRVERCEVVAALGLSLAVATELLLTRISSEEIYATHKDALLDQALAYEARLCTSSETVPDLPDRGWYLAMWNCR